MAAPTTRVYVVGLAELSRELKRLADDGTWSKELAAASKQAAEVVVPVAKSKAPKLSGRLSENIRARGSQRKAAISVGGQRIPYAFVHEFGWRKKNITARPFIYPAIRQTHDQVVDAFGDAVDRLTARAFPGVN